MWDKHKFIKDKKVQEKNKLLYIKLVLDLGRLVQINYLPCYSAWLYNFYW